MAHKAAIRILPDNGDCKSVRATLGVTRAYHRQESETSGDQYRLGEGAKEGVKESDLEVSVFKGGGAVPESCLLGTPNGRAKGGALIPKGW